MLLLIALVPMPASATPKRGSVVTPQSCQPCNPPVLTPGMPGYPGTPYTPGMPYRPGTPGMIPPITPNPMNPANPMTPMNPTDPMNPANPNVPTPPVPNPNDPNAQQPNATPPAQNNDQAANQPFAQPTEAGTQPAASFDPNVLGDQGPMGLFNSPLIATLPNGARLQLAQGQTITLPAGTVLDRSVTIAANTVNTAFPPGTVIPAGTPLPVPVDITASAPAPFGQGPQPLAVNVLRGAFKIAENEGVRPVDRIYLTYNFFSNVNPFIVPPGTPATNVHRQTLGIEKTFWDGDASIGFRLPFLQVDGGFSTRNFDAVGDLTLVSKFALINDDDFGVSAGLVLSLPTGGRGVFASLSPEIHPTIFQPWVGARRTMDAWFLQGFSSIAVPTDDRDVTFLFNDIQVGYIFRPQNSAISLIMPLAELHVNTPLNHREILQQPIGAADIVNITGGVAIGFGQSSLLNLGIVTPVTGPKPFDVEALIQLNVFY